MKGTRTRSKATKQDDKKQEKEIDVAPIRERSRDKEITHEKNIEQEFKITLKSGVKNLIDHFVDTEIKKKYNKNDYHSNFKKLKNESIYNFSFKDKKTVDDLIEKILNSEIFLNSDMTAWVNDEELKIPNQPVKTFEENILKFNSLEVPTKEISVMNIPDKMNNDKLNEIFFIYGDISKIEFNREQVRIK